MKICWPRTGWIAAAAVAVLPAAAETFHSQDGVVFEGTIRRVVTNAAICNVLEENHSEEQYERLKANQGRPLHLWQVDFTVRNGSGRPLDYLRASGWVRSEWPPCTNWSGEGPGGGPLLPDPGLPLGIHWSDHHEVLQMPYGMRLDQQERRSQYLIVFDGQQPRFGEWDIDYRFAKEAGAEPAGADRGGGTSARQSGPAEAAAVLPPEIQVDLNLRKAEQAVREGDAAAAREAMERLEELEREHGLEPAPEDQYRYAQAWAAAGEPERALAAAVRYLQAGGREAEHYTAALDLINRGGSLAAPAVAGNAAASRVGPVAPAGTPRVTVVQPRAGGSREFDGMEFVWVPSGEFLMGSTSSEANDNEHPLTRVRISRGFWLGKHEVTQDQWQAVMGSNPSKFSGCGNCPVEQVSWDDAQEFIGRLNQRSGEGRFRLPTEAEWEYAARAGTRGDRYGNLDAIAWYSDNSGDRTHPVGRKAPNVWGLHDMLGNVSEWVEDYWYNGYPGESVTDPTGPGSGSFRVLRGCGWLFSARFCRASNRGNQSPGIRLNFLGFRLLRTE